MDKHSKLEKKTEPFPHGSEHHFFPYFRMISRFYTNTTITAEMNYIISFYITPRTSKGVINIYEADI